jgi:hypothetical protein
MNEIRAFVGHSFAPDDEIVVGKFLKYFNQVSDSQITFSWNHAESAEPTILAEKIKLLLADRNVFIGICTKKERVVSPSVLTGTLFPPGFLKASKGEFLWKTSDWIIQEIGLAIGKGLSLILLLERGLSKPGGLQGDIEHIEFDREHPERSFGKVLEMINALRKLPGTRMRRWRQYRLRWRKVAKKLHSQRMATGWYQNLIGIVGTTSTRL